MRGDFGCEVYLFLLNAFANFKPHKADNISAGVFQQLRNLLLRILDELLIQQADFGDKPEEIIEKMISGRVNKFLAESSLVEQPFVKDPDVKVGGLLKQAGADILGFVRFEVGEGIEVEATDFAAEVAAQVRSSG